MPYDTAVLCMGCHFIYNNGGRARFSSNAQVLNPRQMKVLYPKPCSTFGASDTQWWNALRLLTKCFSQRAIKSDKISKNKRFFGSASAKIAPCEKHFVRSLKALHHCVASTQSLATCGRDQEGASQHFFSCDNGLLFSLFRWVGDVRSLSPAIGTCTRCCATTAESLEVRSSEKEGRSLGFRSKQSVAQG